MSAYRLLIAESRFVYGYNPFLAILPIIAVFKDVDCVMVDNRRTKVWEPFSKQIKFPDEDWAVLESVYNDYRYRQGDLQRGEFIKRMVAKGVTSYLFQLRSKTPEALVKIAEASRV